MATTKETVQIQVQVNSDGSPAKTVGSIKQQLREAQAAAIEMSRSFGELSPEAQSAARRVAELRDEISDLNERVGLMDPGEKFQVFGNAIGAVTAGFTAAQGALAVFGDESEDLQKQLVKLQGAMALSQSLSTIADSWKDFQRLGAVIKTNVVGAFSTLRKAIISTGIGALLVALGLIIANFDKIEAKIKELFPAFEGFGKLFDKIKAIAMGALNAIIESFKIVGDIIVDIFKGDFKGAVAEASNAGKRMGQAYVEGFNKEVQDQMQEAAREATEALIKQQENDLKVLRAAGATREREADALELKIAQNKIKVLKDGTKEEREAQAAAFADLEALRIQQAQKEGQRQLKFLQDRQALETQQLTDAGKSTIGLREKQLQQVLALEKRFGLDTKDTLQELRQSQGADRRAEFDKELQVLQDAQDKETKAAEISGKNMLHLKEQQLIEQKNLYQKYGYETLEIDKQIGDSLLDQRSKLNDTLNKTTSDLVKQASTGLQGVAEQQAKFNEQNNERIAKDATRLDEIERQKQKAISDTTYIIEQSAQAGEDRSETEQVASAVLAVAMIGDELSKQDALTATGNALKVATGILGQQTAIGKGVAIADATISTYQAAQSSFTALSPIPIVGPALGAIAAAAAVVAGIARVKKIVSTQIPGAGGNGGASAAGPSNVSAPLQPTIAPNATTLLKEQVEQQSQQGAIRVEVLESDITSTQNKVKTVEELAKF
ncbi:hypothetical protein [Chitinophaga sp.]|uniref:hypothetical protein n=1 Tax=Chitinophaga sp. TaxID=1869181 RepID=UPI002CC37F3E|nr:hypothetical protein [Chitinophaga sp.]HWV66590.1 hypothetical protein [Chitinophaga sp.]